MWNKTTKLLVMAATTALFLGGIAIQTSGVTSGRRHKPVSVVISAPQAVIESGEPLVIKLTYRFKEPNTAPGTNVIIHSIHDFGGLFVEIKEADSDWLQGFPGFVAYEHEGLKYYPLPDQPLIWASVQGADGLEYVGYSLVLDDSYKGKVFGEPGTYHLLAGVEGVMSNVIEIQVKPQSFKDRRLLDQVSCNFMMGKGNLDPSNYAKVMKDLKTIVEKRPDSFFGRLAAARLGVESFGKAETERTKAGSEKREPSRHLFKEAKAYFVKGLELPDDFPLREKILYHLAETEYGEGNYLQSLSYLYELRDKYPQGRYGRDADGGIAEITAEHPQLMESAQPQDANGKKTESISWNPYYVGSGIALAMCCGVLFLFARLKKQAR